MEFLKAVLKRISPSYAIFAIVILGLVLIRNAETITTKGITLKKTVEVSSELNFEYTILSSFHDVDNDILIETERSNTVLKMMFVTSFRKYLIIAHPELSDVYEVKINHYRLVLDGQLNGPIMDITEKSAFRNHFPSMADTAAVHRHTFYVAESALNMSVSDISLYWQLYFPELDRTAYVEYMRKNDVLKKAVKVKAESLKRIEQRKLQVITAIQSTFPDADEQFIKLRWAAMYK